MKRAAILAGHVCSSKPENSIYIKRLNKQSVGEPIFFVPGAWLEAVSMQYVAAQVPVPVYGFSWPAAALPRSEWPATLTDLATFVFEEVKQTQPVGPYRFIGHSFGARLALEIAKVAEQMQHVVRFVILLDPRILGNSDVGKHWAGTGVVEALPFVAALVPTESEFGVPPRMMEDIYALEPSTRDDGAYQQLGKKRWDWIQSMHEKMKWYSDIISGAAVGGALRARIVWIPATQTCLITPPSESHADQMIREFEREFYEDDEQVAKGINTWLSKDDVALVMSKVSGGHMNMLTEPHVGATCLQVCLALTEADL